MPFTDFSVVYRGGGRSHDHLYMIYLLEITCQYIHMYESKEWMSAEPIFDLS